MNNHICDFSFFDKYMSHEHECCSNDNNNNN